MFYSFCGLFIIFVSDLSRRLSDESDLPDFGAADIFKDYDGNISVSLPSNSAMRRSIASRFNFTSVPIALNFVFLRCFLRFAALFRILRTSYRRCLKLAANRLNFIYPDRSHS